MKPRRVHPDGVEYDEEGFPMLLPTLPPDGSPPISSNPPGGVDLRTGKMTVSDTATLAPLLHWAVSSRATALSHHRGLAKTDHPQKAIRVGDAEIKVDAPLAPLIRRLNAIGCQTITSCEGTTDTEFAYIMFTESGGRKFQKFWHRRLAPLGYAQPVLDHELRDADWRSEIGRDYPFPSPVPVDPDGTNFTLLWKLHREELEELMPHLLDALSRELQEQWHG